VSGIYETDKQPEKMKQGGLGLFRDSKAALGNDADYPDAPLVW